MKTILLRILRVVLQTFNQTRTSPLGVTLAILISFSLGVSINGDIKLIDASDNTVNNGPTVSGDHSIAIGELNIQTVIDAINNILATTTTIQEYSYSTDIDTSIVQIQSDAYQALQIINQLKSIECTPVAEKPIPSPDRTNVPTFYLSTPFLSNPAKPPKNIAPNLRRNRNSDDRDRNREDCDAEGRVAPNGSKYWICDPNGGNY
jgi:hypothetical protein